MHSGSVLYRVDVVATKHKPLGTLYVDKCLPVAYAQEKWQLMFPQKLLLQKFGNKK